LHRPDGTSSVSHTQMAAYQGCAQRRFRRIYLVKLPFEAS
jgi:hypothetical protein